jgi:hypothetical protein
MRKRDVHMKTSFILIDNNDCLTTRGTIAYLSPHQAFLYILSAI